MWWRRLVVLLSATALVGGSAISLGSGTASALPTPGEIFAAAKQVASFVSRRFGAAETEIEPLFVSQVTKLTPVADDAEFLAFQSEWKSFTPRLPAAGEVTARPRELSGEFKEAASMVCQTGLDVLAYDDPMSWNFAVDQMNGHIMSRNPIGRRLAMYNELNDIGQRFASHCICAGVAKLSVFVAKEVYC